MTYCVGLRVSEGLVLLADTQTNAGLDNVSRFTKMFSFEKPGERVMTLLTAGNLSITQGVIARLRYGIQRGAKDSGHPTIMSVESMFEVAQLSVAEMKRMQSENSRGLSSSRGPRRMPPSSCRAAQRRQAPAVSHLLGREFHPGDGRHPLLPAGRA